MRNVDKYTTLLVNSETVITRHDENLYPVWLWFFLNLQFWQVLDKIYSSDYVIQFSLQLDFLEIIPGVKHSKYCSFFVTCTNSSATKYAPFKNLYSIHNSFDIWQRRGKMMSSILPKLNIEINCNCFVVDYMYTYIIPCFKV